MIREEFYMDMPKELNPFGVPSNKHYINGKELRKSFIRGAKVIVANRLEEGYTIDKVKEEAEKLFDAGQQYFIKGNKIFKINHV